MAWVVSTTPLPLYPWERAGIHCAGDLVGPRPVWTDAECIATTEVRSRDEPAFSESLYRLSTSCPTSVLLAFCGHTTLGNTPLSSHELPSLTGGYLTTHDILVPASKRLQKRWDRRLTTEAYCNLY